MKPRENLLISDCEISFDPITDHLAQTFSKADLKTYANLVERAQHEPKIILSAVIAFKDQHPDIPEVLNLLAYVYAQLRNIARAEELIREAYAKKPHYLFAKINYADQVLRHKKPELVPAIFDHKFDLRALYPERQLFHISEFRGFMVAMGFYHLAIGDKAAAENYYHLAMQADPAHLSVWTLEKKLFRRRILKKILRALENLARNFRIT